MRKSQPFFRRHSYKYHESLKFYTKNHELALDCLAYRLSQYYDIVMGQAKSSRERSSLADAQDLSYEDQVVLAPSLEDLIARRESAGKCDLFLLHDGR